VVTPVRRTGAEDVLGVGVDLRHLGHGPVERGVETSRLRQAGEGLGQRKGTAHVVGSCVGSSLVDDRESRPGARLNLQDRGPLHRPIRQKRILQNPRRRPQSGRLKVLHGRLYRISVAAADGGKRLRGRSSYRRSDSLPMSMKCGSEIDHQPVEIWR
jgi:hypothetical protein